MDDSEEPEGGSETAGERFSSFTKRNILLVAVFFLSNLLTAVSTLFTAVTAWEETRTDWRAAEYRKLRGLRAGYTLEKFQRELGPPVFRTPLAPDSAFVRNVYRPREQYWVEAISNKSNAAVTYAVTTCDPTFRPEFVFVGGDDRQNMVVLNQSTLSEVLPAQEQRGEGLKIFVGGTGGSYSLVFHSYGRGGGTRYREFAWGLNDVCLAWRGKTSGRDLEIAWGRWYREHLSGEAPPGHVFVPTRLDEEARDLMAESVVNTYAETASNEQMLTYYPTQIGVDRLTVQ
ncbi:ETEC_3214 domain-containing protein [Streptomyces sp. CA-252508]|uniref:ETEC_3214 domain-containing protein n=1 Tax=Streptomyces sp. CA-252508 TaxID=3418946 RepID=UPI003D907CD9